MRGVGRSVDGRELAFAVAERAGQQAFKCRSILASEVGDVTAVHPKQHFGGGVAELPRNPFGAFTARQPQGGGSVAALIGTAFLQAKKSQIGRAHV